MLLILIVLVTCSSAPRSMPGMYTVQFTRMVDLSHVIKHDMPHLPGSALTRIVPADEENRTHIAQLGAPNGTWLSIIRPAGVAPVAVEQLAPYELLTEVVVLDVRDYAQDNSAYRLGTSDIVAWEQQHGPVPADALVLLATGWDIRWTVPADYLHLDAHQNVQVPGVSAAAVDLLFRQRQVRGLGLDLPALQVALRPDELPSLATRSYWLLLENLTNVEQLPPTGATLVISVLKIEGSVHSPIRALALVP